MKKLGLIILFLFINLPAYSAGLDSYVTLLMHCDGADTSTTFIDSSLVPHELTGVNQAQIDTADSKFDGASCLFDGTADHVYAADSVDWAFGTGAFTIDGWIKSATDTSTSWNQGALGQYINNDNFWYVVFEAGNCGGLVCGMRFYYEISNVRHSSGNYTAHWENSQGWNHFAVTKADGSVKVNLYKNGTVLSKTEDDTFSGNYSIASPLYIGDSGPTKNDTNGWLDEIRISKGIDRYGGSSFDVETVAYSEVVSSRQRLIRGYKFLDAGQRYTKRFVKRLNGGYDMVLYNFVSNK